MTKINMIKRTVFSLLVITLTVLSLNNAFSYSAAPGVPKVTASANQKSYSPGETGYFTLHFKTTDHVKIPKDPNVIVTVNGVSNDGIEDYSGEPGDYINSGKVKVKFTVPSDAVSGSKIKVNGAVKFGYCSTDDGTCRLAKKEYSFNIKVK